MISITRHRVPPGQVDSFVTEATGLLEAMARRPGFVGGRVARAVDDPQQWVVLSEWVDVGSYRRALGDVGVRVHAATFVAGALDGPGDPTGFEVLAFVDDGGAVSTFASAASPGAHVVVAPTSHPGDRGAAADPPDPDAAGDPGAPADPDVADAAADPGVADAAADPPDPGAVVEAGHPGAPDAAANPDG